MIIPDCADDGATNTDKFLLSRKLVDVYLFECRGLFLLKAGPKMYHGF